MNLLKGQVVWVLRKSLSDMSNTDGKCDYGQHTQFNSSRGSMNAATSVSAAGSMHIPGLPVATVPSKPKQLNRWHVCL